MKTHTTTPTHDVIRAAGPDDVADIGRTLADAFLDDPLFGWCIPDAARRAAVLPAFFALSARAAIRHGASELTADGAAVALWAPAGTDIMRADEADEFAGAVAELLGDDMARTGELMALLDEHHPTEPCQFLWFLGVRSAAQGGGLGSALLTSTLERLDELGVAAYLDATSPANRRLYERHGFVVTAERSVLDSPPMWAMWRAPVSWGDTTAR